MGIFNRHSSDEKRPDNPPPDEPPPDYPGTVAPPPPRDAKQPTPQQSSKPPPSPQPIRSGFGSGPSQLPTSFAALLLSRSDRLRTIGFPSEVVQVVDQAISRVWVTGIQQRGAYEKGSWEWKLSGRPWYGQGIEAITARRLLIHVLHALAAHGWHVAISADMSKKGYDKDTIFFKSGPPRVRIFFCLSFNESDKVRIIDSPNKELTRAFEGAIKSSWPMGIQETREKETGAWQVKLRGNPWWTSNGTEINSARRMGCAILAAMENQGYELVTSVDMSQGSGEGSYDRKSTLSDRN